MVVDTSISCNQAFQIDSAVVSAVYGDDFSEVTSKRRDQELEEHPTQSCNRGLEAVCNQPSCPLQSGHLHSEELKRIRCPTIIWISSTTTFPAPWRSWEVYNQCTLPWLIKTSSTSAWFQFLDDFHFANDCGSLLNAPISQWLSVCPIPLASPISVKWHQPNLM